MSDQVRDTLMGVYIGRVSEGWLVMVYDFDYVDDRRGQEVFGPFTSLETAMQSVLMLMSLRLEDLRWLAGAAITEDEDEDS